MISFLCASLVQKENKGVNDNNRLVRVQLISLHHQSINQFCYHHSFIIFISSLSTLPPSFPHIRTQTHTRITCNHLSIAFFFQTSAANHNLYGSFFKMNVFWRFFWATFNFKEYLLLFWWQQIILLTHTFTQTRLSSTKFRVCGLLFQKWISLRSLLSRPQMTNLIQCDVLIAGERLKRNKESYLLFWSLPPLSNHKPCLCPLTVLRFSFAVIRPSLSPTYHFFKKTLYIIFLQGEPFSYFSIHRRSPLKLFFPHHHHSVSPSPSFIVNSTFWLHSVINNTLVTIVVLFILFWFCILSFPVSLLVVHLSR